MASKSLIYGLVDPRTLLVRYVGMSSYGLSRPRQHLVPKHSNRTYCAKWVRSVQAAGHQVQIVVLDTPPQRDLAATEIWWIAYGRACGWPLTNLTSGGEGAVGTVWSDARRAAMSLRFKGRIISPETRLKLRAANLGRHVSTETRQKQSAARKGKKATAAHKKAISDALKGKPKSDAHRQNLRKPKSQEHREKLRQSALKRNAARTSDAE